MIIEILFWALIFLLIYNYALYPVLLLVLAAKKEQHDLVYDSSADCPYISILIPAYNEEAVITDKLDSIYKNNYPIDQFEVLVGSDASTDGTNDLVENYAAKHDNVSLRVFQERTGKPGIINALVQSAKGEVLILSDADVLFDDNTIFELIKHFKDPKISLVDSNMINTKTEQSGISKQEGAYIKWEVIIKNLEGKLWGKMMGPFGGCYAIRKVMVSQVPDNYVVDDFYIAMRVLENNGKSINELNARCYESVSNDLAAEFKRKIRISAGNFQNLLTFAHLLWPPASSLAFAFFSHKVLRWLGPFLIIAIFIMNLLLLRENDFYLGLFILQSLLIFLIAIDWMLRNLGIHSVILRYITHFYAMNLALLFGFVKFIGGIKSNVWQPTQRNR